MEKTEVLKQKEVKILKCSKRGKEYIYDTISQKCPECGGTIKEGDRRKIKGSLFLNYAYTHISNSSLEAVSDHADFRL